MLYIALGFYVGCYNDNKLNRALNATGADTVNKNPGGSIESCLLLCMQLGQQNQIPNGYDYVGLENRLSNIFIL
jgi:hypothetical protein